MLKKSTLFIALFLSGCDGMFLSSSLTMEEARSVINRAINKECVYTRFNPKEDISFNTIKRIKDPITGVISNDPDTGIISIESSQLHLAQAYALKNIGLIEEIFYHVYQGEKTKTYYTQPNTLNPTITYNHEKVQSKPGHTFRITNKGKKYLRRDVFNDAIEICVGRKMVKDIIFDKDDANKEKILVEYTIKPNYYLEIVTNQEFLTAFKNIKAISNDNILKAKHKVYLVKGKNEYLVENDPAFSTGQ